MSIRNPFSTLLAASALVAAAHSASAQEAMKAGDAMSEESMVAEDSMMAGGMMDGDIRTITITIENLTTGQGFSPSFFISRAADGDALFALDATASDPLVSVAEGGNIGGFSS
jgi:hypothetical protein